MSYLTATENFYREAAQTPLVGLCCTDAAPTPYPELSIPPRMHEMNYGCGTTIQPKLLAGSSSVLYIGVGGGLEALQLAYFTRRPGGVIAVEPVAEMREAATANLREAASRNPWFDESFVEIRHGDAFSLPVEENSIDVVAQNCLFNIFTADDLRTALKEVHRVLRCGGKLSMSDPIAEQQIPEHLRADDRLRAMCLSGAVTFEEYVTALTTSGFGEVQVHARRPYRVLDCETYGLTNPILLESIDTIAVKTTVPADGPCVFTGRYAIYAGAKQTFGDGNGHTFTRGVPLSVCDKTARQLGELEEVIVTDSTWHFSGQGCC